MSGFQHRRHAGRAHLRIVCRVAGQTLGGLQVSLSNSPHVGLPCTGLELRLVGIEGAHGIGQPRREFERGQPIQRGRQLVDGVVRARLRTVSAFVGRFGREGDVNLFTGLHAVEGTPSIAKRPGPRVRIQDHAGVEQRAMGAKEPADAFLAAGLFIGRESNDDVAGRHVRLTLEAQQCRGDVGVLTFHIEAATAVKPAILLSQHERRHGPVFGLGRHDIEMAQVQEGLAASVPLQPDDQVRLGRMFGVVHHDKVGCWKACRKEAGAQSLHRCHRAFLVGRIDSEQLCENRLRRRGVLRGRYGGLRRCTGRGQHR